jgi:hypothetical protein
LFREEILFMDVSAVLVHRSRNLIVAGLGVIFALSGVLAMILSGEDFYSLIVGAVFFLVGAGMVIFSERVEGNI